MLQQYKQWRFAVPVVVWLLVAVCVLIAMFIVARRVGDAGKADILEQQMASLRVAMGCIASTATRLPIAVATLFESKHAALDPSALVNASAYTYGVTAREYDVFVSKNVKLSGSFLTFNPVAWSPVLPRTSAAVSDWESAMNQTIVELGPVRERFTPVTFVHPASLAIVGFDLISSPERAEAFDHATATGMPAVSRPLLLFTGQQNQIVLHVPAYHENELIGVSTSALLVSEIVDSVRDVFAPAEQAVFKVDDMGVSVDGVGDEADAPSLLFKDAAFDGAVDLLQSHVHLNFIGHDWRVTVRVHPTGLSENSTIFSVLLVIAALMAMGVAFFWFLALYRHFRLGQLAAELRRALAAKSAFLAKVSHELRTPLNGITHLVGMALDDDDLHHTLDGSTRETLCLLRESGNDLVAIVENLLEMSHSLSDSALELARRQPLDVESLAVSVTSLMQSVSSAPPASLSFIVDVSPRVPPCVAVDAVMVRHILLNLLGNAAKFAAPASSVIVAIDCVRVDGGRLPFNACSPIAGLAHLAGSVVRLPSSASSLAPSHVVTLKRAATTKDVEAGKSAARDSLDGVADSDAEYLAISVGNAGEGADEAALCSAFEPFVQLNDHGRRDFQGVGLGLAVVAQCTRSHGGMVAVRAAKGVGAEILVLLPVNGDDADDAVATPPPPPSSPSARVLVIDANDVRGKALADALGAEMRARRPTPKALRKARVDVLVVFDDDDDGDGNDDDDGAVVQRRQTTAEVHLTRQGTRHRCGASAQAVDAAYPATRAALLSDIAAARTAFAADAATVTSKRSKARRRAARRAAVPAVIAEAAADEAAVATLAVPVAIAEAAADEAAAAAQRLPASPRVFSRTPLVGYHVLVADDNFVNSKVLSHCLTRAGATVTAVKDGLEAVRVVCGDAAAALTEQALSNADASAPFDPSANAEDDSASRSNSRKTSLEEITDDNPRRRSSRTGVDVAAIARQMASMAAFDAVLLDVRMPHVSGIEAARAIRRFSALAAVSAPTIIFVTADVTPETRAECVQAGGRDVLTKPFDRERVIVTVQQARKLTQNNN